jgi:hypothetical protein
LALAQRIWLKLTLDLLWRLDNLIPLLEGHLNLRLSHLDTYFGGRGVGRLLGLLALSLHLLLHILNLLVDLLGQILLDVVDLAEKGVVAQISFLKAQQG